MSTPAPWQCPACEMWLAPHVTEHRCDPPQAGVTVTPLIPGPAGSTGTSISTGLSGTVVVYGSVTSERDLIRAVQKGLLRNATRNWRTA